ncbi:MAG: dihydroorotate dehydrogenase electron transfer subunit [Bacteroidota bacterium]|nr:dihydroorotate dehydrogenase electron transfer subunit [Bacteroidota bacterium]
MVQTHAPVHSVEEIASGIFRLVFRSHELAATAQPGQFVNVKVNDSLFPLLRRPFSIFFVEGDLVSILFNVIGEGTRILVGKKPGDVIDVIGPLGNGFSAAMNSGGYKTAVIVAGGLGIAPFPFFLSKLEKNKNVLSFIGARTANQIVRFGFNRIHIATDDGSEGFSGNVVDLLAEHFSDHRYELPRIFSCGPTRMLKRLSEFTQKKNIACYASLECAMACGIGLCQGCPVETINGKKKYALVCREGPVFETGAVFL